MEFEWDDNKSQQTFQDRGFDFGFANQVFSDPSGFREPDQRLPYGEDRFRFYGEIQGKLFVVIYTESSTPSGKSGSESSPPEKPTLVKYRLTASGELKREKGDGSWDTATAQADWERIDSTTDAEIERQEIADLVEAALHLQVGGLAALAARLDVSPSSVRRWRRARVMPSAAHQQRLHHLLTTLPAGDLIHDRSHP